MNLFNTNASLKVYSNQGNPAVLGLVPHGARKILDVGCGDGTNAALLVATGAVVDGITLSADEALIAGDVWGQV